MSLIQIDNSLCCGDSLCVRVCPAKCLRMKGNKATTVPLSDNLCLRCGQCIAVCPKSAITLNELAAQPESFTADTPLSPAMSAKLIKTRRSVRDFKDLPVPRNVLAEALEVARYAPTGKNRQDIGWIALDDKNKMKELVNLIIAGMRNLEGTQRLISSHEKGLDPIFYNAPCAIFAHATDEYDLSPADCSLAVGYLDLVLHSMGLGACWAGFAIRLAQNDKAVSDFLGVPAGRKIYAGLMLGYPSVHYKNVPPRKDAVLNWL